MAGGIPALSPARADPEEVDERLPLVRKRELLLPREVEALPLAGHVRDLPEPKAQPPCENVEVVLPFLRRLGERLLPRGDRGAVGDDGAVAAPGQERVERLVSGDIGGEGVALPEEHLFLVDVGEEGGGRFVEGGEDLEEVRDGGGGEVALDLGAVSYTHLRAHETRHDLVCRL